MLKEKVWMKREEAVMITADFGGAGVEGYAMAWLKLTNNAREYRKVIYKIFNSNSDKVYVICKKGTEDMVKDFLTDIVIKYDTDDKGITKCTRISKVIDSCPVNIGKVVYECESTCMLDDPNWDRDMDESVQYLILNDQ